MVSLHDNVKKTVIVAIVKLEVLPFLVESLAICVQCGMDQSFSQYLKSQGQG